jgi:hypothetical protein
MMMRSLNDSSHDEYSNIVIDIVINNKPFDENEIGNCISSLSRNKVPGMDLVVSDFFIDANTFTRKALMQSIKGRPNK